MATHCSILAWEISWTEELVEYSLWGHKRVGCNLATKQQHQRIKIKIECKLRRMSFAWNGDKSNITRAVDASIIEMAIKV